LTFLPFITDAKPNIILLEKED